MRLFIRSIDVSTDARLQRFTAALRHQDEPFLVAFWHRSGPSPNFDDPALIPFSRKAPIGARWGNVFGILEWNAYVARAIWRRRQALSSVQAVDLDCALIACISCLLLRIPFIFDIYDSYPDSRGMRGITAALVRRIEGWVATRADLTIIADAERRHQHRIGCGADVLVVENVPATDWAPTPMPNMPLTLGYLGNLEAHHRGLEDVLEVVSADPRYRLLVAGTGALEQRMREAAASCDRITFAGPVEHRDGMTLMARCNIMLGLYYLSVPNHRYAAPNKYYEHLILGRPLLTTCGTPPGAKVVKYGTGWAITDGAAAISNWLSGLDHDAVAECGARARARWEECYDDYVATVINGEYVRRAAAIERVEADLASKTSY